MLIMSLPPGPRLPLAVQTALLWRLPRWWFTACHRRYGDTFTVRAAPMGTIVYLTRPADIRDVFAGDPTVFHAGEANTALRGVVGDSSVLLLDDEKHRNRRRAMLPPFHREAVRRQVDQIAAITAADIATWPVGRDFPVAERTRAITLEVILRVVIGTTDPVRLAALRRTLAAVIDMSVMATAAMARPELVRLRPWRAVRQVRADADRLLHAEIAACRADPALAERTDVLAMLVRASDENGQPVGDAELRDQLMTLLAAGHETTATGLAWAFERLVRHPDVLARAVQAARDDDDEYLDAIVKEVLRVRPVIFDVYRKLTAPVELAGYHLPAGTIVAPGIGLVHAAEEIYPYPERFEPSRMIGTTLTPTTWLPFGGGARRCLGATFALVEMRVVLREVLRSVELATTAAAAERQRVRNITLAPHRGARIRVLSRRAAPVAATRA